MRETVMTQLSVRQAARRAALNAQAVLRKERADRERRLEGVGGRGADSNRRTRRSGLGRGKKRREALRTMTDDGGLSVRAAADWCGNAVMMREVTRLRRLAPDTPSGAS
jgi:hypothetical protein